MLAYSNSHYNSSHACNYIENCHQNKTNAWQLRLTNNDNLTITFDSCHTHLHPSLGIMSHGPMDRARLSKPMASKLSWESVFVRIIMCIATQSFFLRRRKFQKWISFSWKTLYRTMQVIFVFTDETPPSVSVSHSGMFWHESPPKFSYLPESAVWFIKYLIRKDMISKSTSLCGLSARIA